MQRTNGNVVSTTAWLRRLAGVAVLAAVTVPAMTSPAQAWWHHGGGVFFGFGPVVIGPPAYYGPPVVYGPPPVYYAPPPPVYYSPAPNPSAYAGSCSAGPYICPLQFQAAIGSACSCPTNAGSRLAGVVQ